MRLFHYALIPVLDNKHLVAQWRECIAIKRQWEKGSLKHRLVSYVMDYDKIYFMGYVISLIDLGLSMILGSAAKTPDTSVQFSYKET